MTPPDETLFIQLWQGAHAHRGHRQAAALPPVAKRVRSRRNARMKRPKNIVL